MSDHDRRRNGGRPQSLLSLARLEPSDEVEHVEDGAAPPANFELEQRERRVRTDAIRDALEKARAEAGELARQAQEAASARTTPQTKSQPQASAVYSATDLDVARAAADRPADTATAVREQSGGATPERDQDLRQPATRAAPDEGERVSVEDRGSPRSDAQDDTGAERRDQMWRPLIDPFIVFAAVWRFRYGIVALTILGAMMGVAFALMTPKQYISYTELLFDPRNLNIVERDLTQSGLPSDATLALVENQVRVITSGSVLEKVVETLDLTSDTEFNGQGDTGFIAALTDWRALFRSGDGGADDAARLRAITAGNLYDALEVERGLKTFVITIGAKSEDPAKAALIANTLVTVFLETYGEIQSGAAGRATSELQSRLGELRETLERAERQVEVYKAENDIINPQGRLITDDEIVKLNDQLSTARARTLELNARADSARSIDLDDAIDGSLPEQVNSSAMTELRSQFSSLRQEADRLSVRLGPRHPQLAAVEAQIAGAREQIRGELRRIVSAIQVDLRRAVQLEQDLASRLAQLKARQASVGGELVTLRELEREAQTARAVYESYLLRARETGEQQSLNTANMSVISAAYPPLRPSGMSRATISVTGMILGLLAGLAIGVLLGIVESLRAAAPRPEAPGPGRGSRLASDRPHEAEGVSSERGYSVPPLPVASPSATGAKEDDASQGRLPTASAGTIEEEADHRTLMRSLREAFLRERIDQENRVSWTLPSMFQPAPGPTAPPEAELAADDATLAALQERLEQIDLSHLSDDELEATIGQVRNILLDLHATMRDLQGDDREEAFARAS